MQPPPPPPLVLLLAVQLLFWAASVAEADSRAQFSQEAASCPSGDVQSFTADGSVRQLIGVQDKRACLVECSLWPQCVTVFHSPMNGTCQLGSLKAWLQLWKNASGDGCVSFTRAPPLPTSLQPKLLMFYNFRFGLANQVNASAFTVTPSNAQRTKLGLELLGVFNSKADVDLMGRGIGQYLNSQRQITFFIKVSATFDYENKCFHLVYNRTAGPSDGISGKWCRAAGNYASFFARNLNPVTYTSHGAFLPGDLVNQLTYSTAVSFDSTAGTKFYYNGTADTGAPTTAESPGVVGDDGLIIGYDIYATFKGFIHCYGVAAAALTLDELKQLDGLC